VAWNATGIDNQLTIGDLRVVAVNQKSRLPTVVASRTENPLASSTPKSVTFTVTSVALVHDLAAGNRVVLTATQHEPTISLVTPRSFVTVHQLQAGPSRGSVGKLDCSDRPLQAGGSNGVADYNNCDFTAAVLSFARLSAVGSATNYLQADFSGADLRHAGLDQGAFWSASLSGADLSNAALRGTTFFKAFAPHLSVVKTGIAGSNFFHADLTKANFSGSTITGTSFASATLAQAWFQGATLRDDDMAYSDQSGADLQGTQLLPESSYFEVNWANANLKGATITPLQGLPRWALATLCNTTLPSGVVDNTDC
jgi:uncharacterized protein YjbI with pentapeptide repeats